MIIKRSDNYKSGLQNQDIVVQESCQKPEDSNQIHEILYEIQSNANLLADSIKKAENDSIFLYLNQIYNYKDFFKYSAPVFNPDLFYFFFSNCINNNSAEIANLSLKILNNLLSTNNNVFIEIMFSSNLYQLIIGNLTSPNIRIKRKSFATITILSQCDPQQSLVFWGIVKTSVCKEVSDFIPCYIYNEILYFQQMPNFSNDQLQEVFDIIRFLVNESNNEQARFDALMIISKGINILPYHQFFITEYSNIRWIQFFVEMINSNKLYVSKKSKYPIYKESIPLIEYGYSILKELVPFLSQNVIINEHVFNLELISRHIDYNYEIDPEIFYQKCDISIVKKCFHFLYAIFENHLLLIQDIIDDTKNYDVMSKIFMIILHSVFEIREIASKILCLILFNASRTQIISLPLTNILEALFCILDFDHQSSEIVLKCFSRVINAFLIGGSKKADIREFFLAYDARDIFINLIEDDQSGDDLINPIQSVCNLIDFDFGI